MRCPAFDVMNRCPGVSYPGMLVAPPLVAEQPLPSQREKTRPLREWLLRHRHHPYPNKEDKMVLAMETHMRVDQVSMWFANTRRQIRKVGMKVWSGGRCDTPIPQRVGNGGEQFEGSQFSLVSKSATKSTGTSDVN